MRSFEDFRRFYETDLQPALALLEEERKRTAQNVITAGLLLGAAALVTTAVVFVFRHPPQFIMFSLIILGAIMALIYHNFTRNYIHRFKDAIIARIAAFVDPSLRYFPSVCVPQSVFLDSRIFRVTPDRYRGEDYISGTIGKTAIELSEIHAESKTSDGKHTHWHTIFKGIFFIADFNKNFDGATVVLPDTYEQTFGFLAQALQSLNFPRGELVKLEDPEFEKLFMVYGTDQVEARYILSTALMRRIVDFRNKTGRPIYLGFTQSKMFLAITREDNLFEPALFRSIVDFAAQMHYFTDLEFITGIVDDFNLNTRIWTKQ